MNTENSVVEMQAPPLRRSPRRTDPATRMPAQCVDWSARRIANIVLTAQVQLAYACAQDARECAQNAARCVEGSWPATPLRELVVGAYRRQARSAETIADDVLAGARQRCGLAYACI
jgi:hypothetical protein